MKTKLLSTIAIAALLASCSSSKKTVEATEAKQIKLTPELAEGKTLFENNCGKCHKLFSPDDFTKEEWEPIVSRMQKKAKITDEQRDLVYNYLVMNK
ncbi:cytochrome c [Flavobacterium okayamense]|uniref:Cytochrome c domain-containing protein n=1 Tax=Flavobacterium okayamense TaxID=2830782 RepID=A0ABM7S5L2_9FLAO|nr:cytochrome c [Flavobacterium okayamense]BCY28764.1 hypothetical protein KK2020170_16320 [Flavobacterium okayamense]